MEQDFEDFLMVIWFRFADSYMVFKTI